MNNTLKYRIQRLTIALVSLVLSATALSAQTDASFSGHFTSEFQEDGLPGAVVLLVADSIVVGRTITDIEGNYKLQFRTARIDTVDQLMVVCKYVAYDDFVVDSLSPKSLPGSIINGNLESQVSQEVVVMARPVMTQDIVRIPRSISGFPRQVVWTEPALNVDREEYISFEQ